MSGGTRQEVAVPLNVEYTRESRPIGFTAPPHAASALPGNASPARERLRGSQRKAHALQGETQHYRNEVVRHNQIGARHCYPGG